MSDPIPFPSNADERKKLADDAKDLLADKAFTAAILALRKEWFAELMATREADTSIQLTMMLQALEAIPQRLQIFVNDQIMAAKRGK